MIALLTILIRSVIIYFLLIAAMRLLGKRQLGELEISELVTALLISEVAAMPIADQNIPLVYAVIPLVTILTIDVLLSVIIVKCPRLKNLATARPSVLIRHGRVEQAELRRIRVSLDELISEVRQAGYGSLDEVDYAILEQNGKISVLPKKSAAPPTAEDLSLSLPERGVVHPLIADGQTDEHNLHLLKYDEKWLAETLRQHGKRAEDVFFLGADDGGTLYWIDREADA